MKLFEQVAQAKVFTSIFDKKIHEQMVQRLKDTNIPDLQTLGLTLWKPPRERREADIKILRELTGSIAFFKELTRNYNENAVNQWCRHMTYEFVPADHYVFRENEKGTKFYVILHGSVSVNILTNDETNEIHELQQVDVLGEGKSFGELALIKDGLRAAAIYALTDWHFAVLEKVDYKRILEQLHEKRLNEIASILKENPIFAGLTTHSLIKLSYYFKENRYYKNQIVYKEGDVPDMIYLIQSGEFKFFTKSKISYTKKQALYRTKSERDFWDTKGFVKPLQSKIAARQVELKILGPGGLFGDQELVTKSNRTSTWVCVSAEAIVLQIPKLEFIKRSIGSNQIWQKMQEQQFEDEQMKHKVLTSCKSAAMISTQTTPKTLRSQMSERQIYIKKKFLVTKPRKQRRKKQSPPPIQLTKRLLTANNSKVPNLQLDAIAKPQFLDTWVKPQLSKDSSPSLTAPYRRESRLISQRVFECTPQYRSRQNTPRRSGSNLDFNSGLVTPIATDSGLQTARSQAQSAMGSRRRIRSRQVDRQLQLFKR